MRQFGNNDSHTTLYSQMQRLKVMNIILCICSSVSLVVSLFLYFNPVDAISSAVDYSNIEADLIECRDSYDKLLSEFSTGKVIISESDINNISSRINNVEEQTRTLQGEIESLSGQLSDFIDFYNDQVSAQIVIDETPAEIEPAVVPSSYAGILSTQGNVPQDFLDEVISSYELVPENVRRTFASDGWKLVVISGDILTDKITDPNTKAGAVTVYKENVIYLAMYDPTSVIHEMGHYIDYKNNFCSLDFPANVYSDEWEKMLAVAESTHVHNYSTTPEYFAESFNMWVVKHDLFCSQCPGTARFIEEHLNI